MKIVVMIPTYNEARNIAPLLNRLFSLSVDDLEVVVVDDNSPDGTAEIVRRAADRDSRVNLLVRTGPRGRGRAGREGFIWALERGADYVLEMDGDGSHDPDYLPRFLKGVDDADVVIGSRFLPGGRAEGRGWLRDTVSALARKYLNAVLGLKVSDPTSGFRLFSRPALQAIKPRTLRANDPFTVTEVLYRCHRRGLRIKEIPIVFRDRKHGESKLSLSILLKYFYRVLKLRFSG
jgi:dolichol-phosphate mannosyltransferase